MTEPKTLKPSPSPAAQVVPMVSAETARRVDGQRNAAGSLWPASRNCRGKIHCRNKFRQELDQGRPGYCNTQLFSFSTVAHVDFCKMSMNIWQACCTFIFNKAYNYTYGASYKYPGPPSNLRDRSFLASPLLDRLTCGRKAFSE